MRISVVNLTSDSSDSDDLDRNTKDRLKNTREKNSQKFLPQNEQSDAEQRAPLFKIIFKDESTSRIYRKRLEDIIKYLVSAKLGEDSESNSRGLVLEIYDQTENPNTTITSNSTARQNGTGVIDKTIPNCTVAFNFNKKIKMESVVNDKAHDQNIFNAFNWGMHHYAQPQIIQESIVKPEFPSFQSLNLKKRKWVYESDLSVLRKKKKVEHVSEFATNLQIKNKSDMLENYQINTLGTPYYDPVWWDSYNAQRTTNENNLEKNNSFFQSQVTDNLVMNKNLSTFTYRVLKVGNFNYTKKRTFSISKDGIEFCAHHLNETSTFVKVKIEMTNIIKIEASFSRILPSLFVYINKKASIFIKETLGVDEDSMAYLDPQSTANYCNKIIILPDHMSENCRVIKNLLKVGLIQKLDKVSADIILCNSFSKILGEQNSQVKLCANEQFLNIKSYSIRVGTYKCSNRSFNVKICNKGLQFQMPKVGNDEIYKKITINFAEINKLYFSLKNLSVLFLHVNLFCAQRIRSLIEMPESDTRKVYFDPGSKIIAEQRLVIVFNKIKPCQQETLKSLLAHTYSAEIYLDKIIHQMLFNHM